MDRFLSASSDNSATTALLSRVLDGQDVVVDGPGIAVAELLDGLAAKLGGSRCRVLRVSPEGAELGVSDLMSQVTGRPGLDDVALETGFSQLTQVDEGCDRVVLMVNGAESLHRSTLNYLQLASSMSRSLQFVWAGQREAVEVLLRQAAPRLAGRLPASDAARPAPPPRSPPLPKPAAAAPVPPPPGALPLSPDAGPISGPIMGPTVGSTLGSTLGPARTPAPAEAPMPFERMLVRPTETAHSRPGGSRAAMAGAGVCLLAGLVLGAAGGLYLFKPPAPGTGEAAGPVSVPAPPQVVARDGGGSGESRAPGVPAPVPTAPALTGGPPAAEPVPTPSPRGAPAPVATADRDDPGPIPASRAGLSGVPAGGRGRAASGDDARPREPASPAGRGAQAPAVGQGAEPATPENAPAGRQGQSALPVPPAPPHSASVRRADPLPLPRVPRRATVRGPGVDPGYVFGEAPPGPPSAAVPDYYNLPPPVPYQFGPDGRPFIGTYSANPSGVRSFQSNQ